MNITYVIQYSSTPQGVNPYSAIAKDTGSILYELFLCISSLFYRDYIKFAQILKKEKKNLHHDEQ